MAVWITVDVAAGGPWIRLDGWFSGRAAGWDLRRAPYPRDLVYSLTLLGNRFTIVVAVGALAVFTAWRRRTWQPIIRVALALVLLVATVYLLKLAVARPAPRWQPAHTRGSSYPSGHVPDALLMWGLAAWLAARYELTRWLRRLLSVLRWLAPIAAFAGMALLDYHWLSDLVAGAAIGIVLLRLQDSLSSIRMAWWPTRRPATGDPLSSAGTDAPSTVSG